METKLNHRVVQLIKRLTFSAVAAVGIGAATLSSEVAFAGGDAPSVGGEYAKAPADAAKSKAALTMLGTQSMQANRAEITFKTMDSKRIESAKAGNSSGGKKALQVGVSRAVAEEATDASAGSPKLKWQPLSDSSQIAYVRITSATAKAMRSGLRLSGAPSGTTLRFVGSDDADPTRAVAAIDINDVTSLADAKGLYWSPVTDGEVQTIEIHVPAGKSKLADISFTVESISHFFASAADKFQSAKAGSGLCNFDVACATQTAGFVNAKNSVAHMVFTVGSRSFICTGTLLNDVDQSTQIPYFYGANHCFDDDSASPNYQAVANTLSTYWFYENAQCGPPDLSRSQSTQVVGGAGVVYNDRASDVLFLRLNRQPPAGVWYSGWDSNLITVNTPTTIIHHPAGDVKKVTIGQVLRFDSNVSTGLTGSYITNGYSRGVTEGGSSGSGIFTVNSGGEYQLRGGLFGGPSGCSGNINDPFAAGNYDYYSRFDLAFPVLRQYLFTGTTGPANYTDLWWAGSVENGWGMSITQHGNTQFNALYIYDNAGQPYWVVMPGGTWNANFTTYSGAVYVPSGSPYYAYDVNQFRANAPVGSVAINFTSSGTAVMSYTINGVSGAKSIARQPFGRPEAGGLVVGDLWWGGQTFENGWGVNLAQQNSTLFGVWYTYDANGRPTWFVMPGGNWSGNVYSGALYRTTSSAWLGTPYNSAQLQVFQVGALTFNFANTNSGTMTYTVNGFTQSKPVARQPF
jgi:lysyl endopeptidase